MSASLGGPAACVLAVEAWAMGGRVQCAHAAMRRSGVCEKGLVGRCERGVQRWGRKVSLLSWRSGREACEEVGEASDGLRGARLAWIVLVGRRGRWRGIGEWRCAGEGGRCQRRMARCVRSRGYEGEGRRDAERLQTTDSARRRGLCTRRVREGGIEAVEMEWAGCCEVRGWRSSAPQHHLAYTFRRGRRGSRHFRALRFPRWRRRCSG
jgi:hypothetical protein